MYYNYIYWFYIEFKFYLHKSDQTPKHENALTYRRARRSEDRVLRSRAAHDESALGRKWPVRSVSRYITVYIM